MKYLLILLLTACASIPPPIERDKLDPGSIPVKETASIADQKAATDALKALLRITYYVGCVESIINNLKLVGVNKDKSVKICEEEAKVFDPKQTGVYKDTMFIQQF